MNCVKTRNKEWNNEEAKQVERWIDSYMMYSEDMEADGAN